MAIFKASSFSEDVKSFVPKDDSPTLPPAFILGPITYPKWYVFGEPSILHKSYRVFKPRFLLFFKTFNPCLTKALLTPFKGTTSQTVPRLTRSNIVNKSGVSILFFLKKSISISFLFKETRKKNVTPAAHK